MTVAFTDELSLNLSYIERLVTYQGNANFTELIPGALYNGTITVDWAVVISRPSMFFVAQVES